MRRPHRLLWPLLAVLLSALAIAAPASADYRDIYDECEQGQLTKQYSAKDLRLAAQRMSSYLRDYSNCSDAIYAAQTSAKRNAANQNSGKPGSGSSNAGGTGTGTGTGSGGGSGTTGGTGGSAGSGSGTSGPASPGAPPGLSADEKYIASTAAAQQVDAGGSLEAALAAAKVPESVLGFSSDGSKLPLSLVVALAASGLLAVIALGVTVLPRLRRFRAD